MRKISNQQNTSEIKLFESNEGKHNMPEQGDRVSLIV